MGAHADDRPARQRWRIRTRGRRNGILPRNRKPRRSLESRSASRTKGRHHVNDEHPATHIEPDDDALDLNAWHCTPEQFAAYKAREVELAKANIRRIRRDHKLGAHRLRDLTLHSPSTLFVAFQAVLLEDEAVKRAHTALVNQLDKPVIESGHLNSIQVTATFTRETP